MSTQSRDGLTGTQVMVNRGGPESETGTLLAIRNDVLVLRPRKGPNIYYNLEHVKSVTRLKKAAQSSAGNGNFPPWLTFRQVLAAFTNRYVQINRGGPEKVDGTITMVTPYTVTLIRGKEIIRLPIHHIRTVNALGANSNNGKSSQNQNGSQSRNGSQSKNNSQQRSSSQRKESG